MAASIVELFGYSSGDRSQAARDARDRLLCPFLNTNCTKTLSDGTVSGACSMKPATSDPVITCPKRLYYDGYSMLLDVARDAFGQAVRLVDPADLRNAPRDGQNVVVFGHGRGHELRVPNPTSRGNFSVDWVLAHLDEAGRLQEFTAVEIQSIDTTGNYRDERTAILEGRDFDGRLTAGLNWENVNKRILPQIIYKGHVLRQEARCTKGLYFVCPTAVYEKIVDRLGGQAMRAYHQQSGALTFRWYGLGPEVQPGQIRSVINQGQLTTTVDQIALAFTAGGNLPPAGSYENAIRRALGEL